VDNDATEATAMPAMPAVHERSPQPLLRRLILVFGLAAALPAGGASIVFYEYDSFRGRSFVTDQTISNFANLGFNDRASSVVIRDGAWQLCTDAFFRGRCVTLRPGEYPTLRSMALENQISSARELDWLGGGGGGARPEGRVELFDGNRFEGQSLAINGPVANFPREWNDRVQSMIVHRGHWEICADIEYRGGCQTYGPGRHANLGAMSNRASSIRPATGPGPGPDFGGWGSGARALLYEGPNLSGRTYVIDNEVMPNLDAARFNDRASSLRVEGGYWVFCSDINFRGECLTFGPGDYPTLPWSLNNRISSGRRISEQYPYSQSPSWPR
jgi:hypothetical protein